MEKIDILIIHLNGEEILKNCLKSIYQNSPKNIGICVLLNATTDNSESMIKDKFKEVRIIKTKKRVGFAEGCNVLAKKSKSKYIVFLNNDVTVEKRWLEELFNTIKRHSNCVACQPKIRSLLQKEKFEYAGAAGGFIDRYGFPFCRGRIFNHLEEDLGQYDDEIRIFWGCGVCLLVEKEFFMKIGMFDEDFFMYGEELDLCWRINLKGKEIWYSPKSVIYHIGSYSTKRKNKKTNLLNLRNDYLITLNHVVVLLKNYSISNLVKIIPFKILLDFIGAIRFFPTKTLSFFKTYLYLLILYITKISKKRREIQKNREIEDGELSFLISRESIAISYFIFDKKHFRDIKFG